MEGFRGFMIRTAEIFVLVLVGRRRADGRGVGLEFGGDGERGAFGGLVGLLIGGAMGFVLGCVGAAYFFFSSRSRRTPA